MTKKEQLEIERQRRETALKNTFFNRYLLLRYTIALFFFGNIYWLLNQFIRPSFVIVLPITLIVLAILATVEQFRLYGKRDERFEGDSDVYPLTGSYSDGTTCSNLDELVHNSFPNF